MARKTKSTATTTASAQTINIKSETIDLKKVPFSELYYFEQASKNMCSMYEQMAKIDEYDNRSRYGNKMTENIQKFNTYVSCRRKIINEIEKRLQCIC